MDSGGDDTTAATRSMGSQSQPSPDQLPRVREFHGGRIARTVSIRLESHPAKPRIGLLTRQIADIDVQATRISHC